MARRILRKTKIVATIGPASDSGETIKAMIRAGMNVARLNFSHGTHAEHRKRIETIREASRELDANLADLHERLRTRRYRHQALRRVHIPKEQGQWRPIGISALEDKIVQGAVREVLEAVYEQDFLDCSHGFRPKRSAHDAVRALNQAVHQGKVSWILEADIESFFDSLDRTKLKEMLQIRVAAAAHRQMFARGGARR